MFDRISLIGKSFFELLSMFMCDIRGDDDYYDVLAANMATNFPGKLESLMVDLEGTRLRAAIFGLGVSEADCQNIWGYLQHSDEMVVAGAIDALSQKNRVHDWNDLASMLKHPSPYVRGASLRSARALLGAAALPYLIDALDDPHGVVRENALDELDGLVPAKFHPNVLKLLDDPVPNVRVAARGVLAWMEAEP